MKKKFQMENEVGISVCYTVLASCKEDNKEYVIYTNYLPSENELGVRLFAGELVDKGNFKVAKITKEKESKLIDNFIIEVVTSGKKIRRVK